MSCELEAEGGVRRASHCSRLSRSMLGDLCCKEGEVIDLPSDTWHKHHARSVDQVVRQSLGDPALWSDPAPECLCTCSQSAPKAPFRPYPLIRELFESPATTQ